MLWGWDPPGAAEPPSTSTTPYPGLLVRLFLPKAVLEDVQLPGRVGGCTPSPPNAGRQLQVLHPTLGWCFSPGQRFPLFTHLFWEGYVAFQDLGLVLQLWGGQGGGPLGVAPALTAWLCPQKAFLVPKIWERREAELGQGGPTWAQPCASPHTFSWLSRGSRVKGRVSPGSLSLVDMWQLCVGVEQLQLQPRSPPRWP